MSNLNFKLMKTKLLLLFVPVLVLAVSLNAQVDPGRDNVTHEWTFDDGTANDPVGFSNGALMGQAVITDGELVIAALESYCEMSGAVIQINTYTELSVATWFTTPETAVNTGYHMIWYFGGSEDGGEGVRGSNGIFLSPARGDNVCRTAISCGELVQPWTAETGVNWTGEMPDDGSTWHVVTTINDSYLAMYINGDLIDTTGLASHNSLANLKNDFAWIGRGGYEVDPNYQCKVDVVTMYNKMLTDEEVLWLYQNPNPSGVNEIQNQSGFKIYESNGVIYIQNKDNVFINSVEVFDVTGRTVYQTDDFTGTIRHNLRPSIYIVKLQSNRGDYISKIMIE
jgi:hypothetical protein